MGDDRFYPPLSPISTGIRGRCPRCGSGKLFNGYLKTADCCSACGLDYGFCDSGDGPAVFIILIVGGIVVPLAMIVELNFHPSYWVHVILWLPLALVLSLGLLRPAKGILLCQQFRTKAHEGRHCGE
ncbi:MAG: DUF983 domain-containing protein [Hyphomicrobiales bacterium]